MGAYESVQGGCYGAGNGDKLALMEAALLLRISLERFSLTGGGFSMYWGAGRILRVIASGAKLFVVWLLGGCGFGANSAPPKVLC
jgi:hypothetical protein